MTEENPSKQVCKLMVVDTFKYNKLKLILEAIESLGYEIEFVDNGNILISEKSDGEKE